MKRIVQLFKQYAPLIIDFIIMILPLLIMLVMHGITRPEQIHYTVEDYYSNMLLIIMIEASARLSSMKDLRFKGVSMVYLLLLIFSTLFYYEIQSNSIRELTGLFNIVVLLIILAMMIVVVLLRIKEFRTNYGE